MNLTLQELIARAKSSNPKPEGLNIGEKCFVTLLNHYIHEYRLGKIKADDLAKKETLLERDMINYRDSEKIAAYHAEINNRYSHLLIQAEKEGCPICKKIVAVLDGRDRN